MNSFKLVVDVLSSLAAIVAITTVLISWGRAKLPPLKITQMVISRVGGGHEIVVRINNGCNYPITINHVSCYKVKSFSVIKNKGLKPSIYPSVNVSDRVFSHENIAVKEKGITDFKIKSEKDQLEMDKFFFSVWTSHGRMDLVCNNVYYYSERFSSVDEKYSFDNRFHAYLKYLSIYNRFLLESFVKKIIAFKK